MSVDSATVELDLDEVRLEAGLDRIGVAPVQVLARTRAELRERARRGLDGGMQFTYRNPARSTDPARILPDARSLVVGARAHAVSTRERPPRPVGRVARYATGSHYDDLARGLEVVADALRALGGRARVVYDDNALVDREVARRAGLGTYGKNANLLVDRVGSWFVLGSVVTDLALAPSVPGGGDPCRACRRCLDACPTGAIVDEGVVDARRCLAWLVQARGVFPAEHREALGDRVYGCDTCQEVCPENRRPLDVGEADPWIDLLGVLEASDAELLERHGSWYLADRDPAIIRRNALIALGNSADPSDGAVRSAIAGALRSADPVLRAHAVWAARRLGHVDVPATDPHPIVQAELDRPVVART